MQLSIHKLGHLRTADGRDGAAGATAYYERATRLDHQGLGLAVPPDDRSMGTWHAFGQHAPCDLDGYRGTPEDLEQALRGEWRGQRVQNAHAPNRVLGWDLTFSAPKSVSVAYAAAGPEDRAGIEAAVRDAVLAAMREVVAPEVLIRRDHAGATREPASFAAIMYAQHLSRANDPQLHYHCVMPNYGWGADEVARTLETAEVYRARVAIGQIASADLAVRLGRLGYAVFRDADGTVRVAGVSPDLETHFSQRSAQIAEGLATAFGPDGVEAASAGQRELVAVLSRPAHDPHYIEDWRDRAAAAGLREVWGTASRARLQGGDRVRKEGHGPRDLPRSTGGPISSEPEALDAIVREAAAVAVHAGGWSVARRTAHPGEAVPALRRVVEEAAARAVGTGADAREILDAVARARAHAEVRAVVHGPTPLSTRVTTPAMIRVEERLLKGWRALAEQHEHGVPASAAMLARLSAEQQDAVRAATAASGVGLVTGVAGAGKTTVFALVREAYEAAGYRVVGEAYSAAAAQALQQGSAIPSRTIALAETAGRDLDHHMVLVLDEAGRIPAGQLARIVDDVRAADAKLILSGDWRQLQPIGPGAALPRLAAETAGIAPEAGADLQAIRRQTDPDVRQVAEAAAAGRAAEALREAVAQHRVGIQPTTEAALEDAAEYLADALERGSAIGLVAYRAETRPLNDAVREALRMRGQLPEDAATYQVGERAFALAPGDLVAFAQNRYDLGVRNGQRTEVVAVNPETREVLLRLTDAVREDRAGHVVRSGVPAQFHDGTRVHEATEPERTVVLTAEHIERALVRHDYARTVDAAQGLTVDRAVVLTHYETQRLDRQWAAVAFTRARRDLRVVVNADGAGQEGQAALLKEPAHWPSERASGQRQLPLLGHEAVAEVLTQTERLLARDRPGSTTLAHPAEESRARDDRGHGVPEHVDRGQDVERHRRRR
jgi:conjugative relaxase-like TrwC/TraI family protein